MWKTGDALIYKTTGVCIVDSVFEESFSSEPCRYYRLRPAGDEKNVILVPLSNEALTSKMLPLLTENEALDIISSFSTLEHPWQDSDKRRLEDFKNTLESQDRRRIASLINTARKKRLDAAAKGKKIRASDEGFCERAEKLLFSELAFVLECSISDICARVFGA